MKLSLFGRLTMALLASVALGLGMTACGGGTIGYMWVLGQQYNQIAGFKIDDYTGNLTTVPKSPFSSGGTKPVSLVVKTGGRFLYVINQGTGDDIQVINGVSTFVKSAGESIVEYAVGGDGTLTYQDAYQTQGFVSIWAQMDSSGTYLYVLDKYAPQTAGPLTAACATSTAACQGAITVFSADPNTGRLSLVTNSQTQTPTNPPVNTTFFRVGDNPIMMKTAGSCLFTVNSADQSVSEYSIGSSGQLTVTSPGTQQLTTTSLTSINGNGTYVYVTDSANGTTNSAVYPFTIGSNCTLTSVVGGSPVTNTGGTNPTNTMIDSSGKYLYVLNGSNTNTTTPLPLSTITAYNVSQTNGQLTVIAESPFTVGSGPVCMVEDPTNKYMYISNHNDGTVTGKVFDPTRGVISDLTRGSTFTAAGQASCLVVSGAVS